MLKVTEKGITELGTPIELTEEDRLEILQIIAQAATPSCTRKRDGRWIQPEPWARYEVKHA